MGVQAASVYAYASLCALALLGYLAVLFISEVDFMLPYSSGFALAVLWGGSVAGGQAAKLVGLPPLLGMLCTGILVKNAGDLARGLPAPWAAAIRAVGLMNILMRGGLEMDLGAVRRLGTCVVRLTVIPGVTEAVVTGAFAAYIFSMPLALGLSLGFILGAVSPAIVVGGMFNLQRQGYGTEKGIPSLVVAAASFDDVVAISGFALCSGLALGQGDVLKNALHGPIDIALGVAGGALGACIVALTQLWDKPWKASAVVILLGLVFTFAAKLAHYAGAGALASLVMAAGANQLWSRGAFAQLSLGPDPELAHHVEHHLALLWHAVSEPLLFSVIGNSLDFAVIEGGTIHKVIGVILVGVLFRCTAAFGATLATDLSTRERAFVALAWMPKATVQAALGSVPLELAKTLIDKDADPDKYNSYIKHGTNIVTIAVFAILITAPAGLIIIQKLGPRWLERSDVVTEFKTDEDSSSPRAMSPDSPDRESAVLDLGKRRLSGGGRGRGCGGHVLVELEVSGKIPVDIAPGAKVVVSRSRQGSFQGSIVRLIRGSKKDAGAWLEDDIPMVAEDIDDGKTPRARIMPPLHLRSFDDTDDPRNAGFSGVVPQALV
mmetsp:Transcript_57943/g.163612  ORF Transcript_57943/g.163612 Transcript_57943/m.163612 type:complete len:606 (+) Transcript_57943:111-1928(+)|eukprot:CAMPEP_0179280934 /NCGR_PEP_ID=MMETSP0797-20121207/36885_1 /TAXON_ID=47934 /ORGANISM="Dinophysis acuminata, Strain DAEP01" /LENGTH=605 /DNA_ID=CAMNT_0020989609 /DNA_START=90 /DNA_END=1907 /DNA_ORIENTATION=+